MKRKANFWIAILPVIFVISLLMIAVLDVETRFGLINITADAHLPLFFGAMFAAFVAIVILGYSWAELEERMIETIKMSMGAILILLVIGMLIGTWVISGIVPALVYYGLDILNPAYFLVAAMVICSVVSLATGTSWGTAGTVGVALMGIGAGLGVDPAITGGAVISGAYFGDKMSPLSDTTNLAPAMAGSTLFDHIRHMIFTSGPAYVLSLALFTVLGFGYGGNVIDATQVAAIQKGLTDVFASMSPILLLGPVVVIALVVLKVPAIPGLFGGAVLGAIFAITLQGADINQVINSFQYGYVSETGDPMIDALLTRGGMDSMLWTINLIICAMCFGGVMEKSGMLAALAETVLKGARSVGGLVIATIFSCIFMNFLAGDQYLSIVIPGRMYKKAYDEAGLAPRNLSRALEDAGTVTSPLIPWNTCGATMIGTLGLMPWTYVPYCFFNILSPVVSIIYGYTGITMMKLVDDPTWKKSQAALAKLQVKPAATSGEVHPTNPTPATDKIEKPVVSAAIPSVEDLEKPMDPLGHSREEEKVIELPIIKSENIETPISVTKETDLHLTILGKTINLSGGPVRMTASGKILLPLITVGEALGYAVIWDDPIKGIVLQKGSETILIKRDGLEYSWNTIHRTFSESPQLFNGKLYVPADFITMNPTLKLNQTTTAITIDLAEATTQQVTTATIQEIAMFSNGLGLTVDDKVTPNLFLYVTEKTQIAKDSTGAVMDRTLLKAGTHAIFTYSQVSGDGQKTFNVLSSVRVLEEALPSIPDLLKF